MTKAAQAPTDFTAWIPGGWRTIVGVCVLSTIAGLIITSVPVIVASLCGGVWALALLMALPSRLSLAAPLVVLLSFPADHISGLNEAAHGFFVLGATALLGLFSVLREQTLRLPLVDWDLHVLSGLLIFAALFHASSGEIRGVLFWVSASLLLYWLRSEERRGAQPRLQVEAAILAAGTLGGLFAVLERAGLGAGVLLGAYRPADLDLSLDMGSRAVGLSGHPLRLGTLTMMSSLVGVGWLTHGLARSYQRTVVAAVLLSLSGLALSGARGSWLGFVIGGVLITVLGDRLQLGSRLARAAAFVVVLGGLAWVTGAWEFFYARAVGSASHPASLEQRIQVLAAIGQAWSQVPVLGLGFGGASEKIMALGLAALNIENEYLRFFLAAGWLAPIALLIVAVRRTRASVSEGSSVHTIIAVTTMAALLVNMATFNVFAWSFGPGLLFVTAFLAIPASVSRGWRL